MSNRVCKLIMVTGQNNNKYYNMVEQADGSISVEYGRVDKTCTKIRKPAGQWNKLIESKVKKGYKDVTHLSVIEEEVQQGSSIGDISDAVIDRLFKQLQAYADKTIKANYKVSSHKVTQTMVDEAQAVVDKLAHLLSTRQRDYAEAYNDLLLELFHIIPRRMSDVRGWLVDTDYKGGILREKCESLLAKEQSTLDVMAGQVIVNTKTDDVDEVTTDVKRDILNVLGLEVKPATKKEIDNDILPNLGDNKRQFKNAYKVVNKVTEKRFAEHMETVSDNKKTELFWHGSRNENWLNILSTGLLIRPSGAIHSGSMFGDGIYFADKAQKSIGYTSLRGSYWARGGDETAYLALFKVHVGNQKTMHTSDSSLCWDKISRGGFDSTYARAGQSLRNNEYIIYRSQQCTINYLVEISS